MLDYSDSILIPAICKYRNIYEPPIFFQIVIKYKYAKIKQYVN